MSAHVTSWNAIVAFSGVDDLICLRADVKRGLSVLIDKLPRLWMHAPASGLVNESGVELDAIKRRL